MKQMAFQFWFQQQSVLWEVQHHVETILVYLYDIFCHLVSSICDYSDIFSTASMRLTIRDKTVTSSSLCLEVQQLKLFMLDVETDLWMCPLELATNDNICKQGLFWQFVC